MTDSAPTNRDANLWQPRYATRAEGMQASEIRELLKLLDEPDIVSFAGGIPDPQLFPVDAIKNAYAGVLERDSNANRVLQYSVSEGDPDLRQWIVDHMNERGITCNANNILITNGSQQALEFAGKLLLSPKDTALVMAPTYLGALQAFSASEPRYDTLQLSDGQRTADDYRDAALDAGGEVKFAYVVPDFANPTGETLTLEERNRLLTLAGELNIPIIEDTAYAALRYDGEDVTPLQALDIEATGSIDHSRVLYCGTFSKTMTPGLRVGWICASRELIGRLVLIKQASDLNSAAINQAVLVRLAHETYDNQVRMARASYREKRDAMLEALANHMPHAARWTRPDGGLFVWVSLPDHINTAKLLERSVKDARVAFVPGHAFFADGSGSNTMRLSFSLPSISTIHEGVKRLAAIIDGEHAST